MLVGKESLKGLFIALAFVVVKKAKAMVILRRLPDDTRGGTFNAIIHFPAFMIGYVYLSGEGVHILSTRCWRVVWLKQLVSAGLDYHVKHLCTHPIIRFLFTIRYGIHLMMEFVLSLFGCAPSCWTQR